MSKVKYDICAASHNEKTDKTYWTKLGVVIETDKGLSMKLEAVPVGWNGWASFFVPKPKDGTQALKDMQDDLP